MCYMITLTKTVCNLKQDHIKSAVRFKDFPLLIGHE